VASWIPKPLPLGAAAAALGNALVFATFGVFAWLNERDADLFYQALQEDEWLEWGTFWGFLLAAVVFGVAAFRQRRRTRQWPWFLAGVGLFCFVVGMEEISWGQRLFGYRPPSYFLEHNFQQELNVHNVVDQDLRRLGVGVASLGYGVALPLVALWPATARGLAALAVVAPPVELVPSFAAAWWVYEDYPFKFSGEVTECMLALAFLFAGLARARELSGAAPRAGARLVAVAVASVLVAALGAANAWASRVQRHASAGNLERVRVELAALARDFAGQATGPDGFWPTRCGLHKRLYTFRRQNDQEFLGQGAFAALKARGLPQERAEFLLDPWDSPYWIRDKCRDGGSERVVFVYSFGPNRRRDSTPWEIGGDDQGMVLLSRRTSR
jgi:hypothetical protein